MAAELNSLRVQKVGLTNTLCLALKHCMHGEAEALKTKLNGDVRVPAKSTIHAVLDRHGLVRRMSKRRNRATGTPLSRAWPALSHFSI
jgi:hypothetical protein